MSNEGNVLRLPKKLIITMNYDGLTSNRILRRTRGRGVNQNRKKYNRDSVLDLQMVLRVVTKMVNPPLYIKVLEGCRTNRKDFTRKE